VNKLKVLLFAFAFVHSAITIAGTYIVNKDGAGDFTTIQAAVDQAAADEDTGPVRQYAYFTQGSDIVTVYDGTSSLLVGELVSADDNTWYEIMEIIDNQTLRLARTFDENNRFGSYKVVAVSEIRIKPGIYEESINLEHIHFVRFRGIGISSVYDGIPSRRESVAIQSPIIVWPDSEPTTEPVFYNIQDYGALYFENLTARQVMGGAILATSSEVSDPNVGEPSDTNLNLVNVHFDAQCCDVTFSPYGHVLIEDSRLESENDVLGGFFKSLNVRRSNIMSLRTVAIVNAGKAVFIKLLHDSLIEDSLIFTKAHRPDDQSKGGGHAIRVQGTNGNTLTIRNSVVVADGGASGIALQLDSTSTSAQPNTVIVENSRLLARTTSGLGSVDIKMDVYDSLTVQCTEYVTNAGEGIPTVLPCP